MPAAGHVPAPSRSYMLRVSIQGQAGDHPATDPTVTIFPLTR